MGLCPVGTCCTEFCSAASTRERVWREVVFGRALFWPEEEPYFLSSRAGEGSACESVEFLPRDFLLPVVCVHPRICVGP